MLICLGAALVAGILASLAPAVLARLPEPADPDEGKPTYADLAARPRLGAWLGLGAAIASGLIALRIPDKGFVPMWVVLMAAGVLLAYIDWHTHLLPYLIVWPLNGTLLLLMLLGTGIERDWSIAKRSLIAAVVVWLLFRIMHQISRSGLGFGDVRLSFGLGLCLGTIDVSATVWGLWIGFVLGALCSIVLAKLKIVDAKGFAFGPYLILGAFIGAIWSPLVV